MGRFSRARTFVFVFGVGALVAACAQVSGLSDYSKGECAGGCDDATADVTVDSSGDAAGDDGADQGAPETTTESGADGEADANADASAEADADAEAEANADAGADAKAEAGVCSTGATRCMGNAVQSCDGTGMWQTQTTCSGSTPVCFGGSCVTCQPGSTECSSDSVETCSPTGSWGSPAACNTTTGSPSCSGASCSYTCNAGLADCNAATAPDTDGCECATATAAAQGKVGGCCSGACQTQHSNGLLQSFYDCAPLGTYNATQALEACAAFTGDASKCTNYNCGNAAVMCSSGASDCDCWEYSGKYVGYVETNTNTTCYCPTSSSNSWN